MMTGRFVSLEPLALHHADDLFAALAGADLDDLARYMVQPPPRTADTYARYIRDKQEARDRRYFACVLAGGRASGFMAFMRDEPAHRGVEIGDVFFAPSMARSAAATEAVFLMARHAFETMGYRRLEWKCDLLNIRSYRAAERFGFTYEGCFRQHMLVHGRSRDSAWFSMLDGEWPARRAAFEHWLAPANFDSAGVQRETLGAIMQASR